jgi:hypothetical protein
MSRDLYDLLDEHFKDTATGRPDVIGQLGSGPLEITVGGSSLV